MDKNVPWITLDTKIVVRILVHLTFTYHQINTVFIVWKSSRVLHYYLPLFKQKFDALNAYKVWCKLLNMWNKHKLSTSAMTYDLGFDCGGAGHEFWVTLECPISIIRLTNAAHFAIVDTKDTTKHSHSSFKSIAFACDNEYTMVVIHRDALLETCGCFAHSVHRTKLAAMIKDIVVDEKNKIKLYIKMPRN